MKSITKHQHYVFREYLRSWANAKDQIWCSIDEKEPYLINISNVAQGNYFYRTTNRISSLEKLLLYHIAENVENQFMQKHQKSMINQYDKLLSVYQDLQVCCNDGNMKEYVDSIIKQHEEKIQSAIESIGMVYYAKLKNKNLDFLKQDEEKAKFYYFVAEQYMRTKKIRDDLKTITAPQIDINNIINPLTHILAQQTGYILYLPSNNYHTILLDNKSQIAFMTADQPVINTFVDYTKINKHTEKLELYYPISPEIAVLISNEQKYSNHSIVSIEADEVKKYNQMMKVSKQKFLFAKSIVDFTS